MFCGQTDTGHKDDIYLYRSSSPRLLAFSLGDKYGTHYEYCVNELTPSFRGEAAGGGGHTSGPICHPSRECSGLFQNI